MDMLCWQALTESGLFGDQQSSDSTDTLFENIEIRQKPNACCRVSDGRSNGMALAYAGAVGWLVCWNCMLETVEEESDCAVCCVLCNVCCVLVCCRTSC